MGSGTRLQDGLRPILSPSILTRGDDRSSLPPVDQVPRVWIAPDSGCVKALPRACLFSRTLDGLEKPAEKTAAGES